MLAITVALIPSTFALFIAAGLGKMAGEGKPEKKGSGFLFAYGLLILALIFARYA